MEEELLGAIIEKIKSTGGVSVDLKKQNILKPLDFWYFPKYPSKTSIVNADKNLEKELHMFIERNKKLLSLEDTILGVWFNSNNNSYYLDITTWEKDFEKAIKKAKQISTKEGRKIVTVYNPAIDKTKYVWNNVLE